MSQGIYEELKNSKEYTDFSNESFKKASELVFKSFKSYPKPDMIIFGKENFELYEKLIFHEWLIIASEEDVKNYYDDNSSDQPTKNPYEWMNLPMMLAFRLELIHKREIETKAKLSSEEFRNKLLAQFEARRKGNTKGNI